MFKNREMRMRFVKTPQEPAPSSTVINRHWHVNTKDVQKVVLTMLGSAVTWKVTETACAVALLKLTTKK